MNKKIYLIIGVVLVLILAVGGFVLISKKTNKSPASTMGEENVTQEQTANQTTEGTLKSLLGLTTPQKCSYSTEAESGSVNGTVYVANGKMRTDVTSNTDTTNMISHMIVDSDYTYYWMEGQSSGYKMTLNQEEPSVTPEEENQTEGQGANLNQKFNYTCSAWVEDDSKFSLPTDVTFTEFSVPTIVPTGTSTNGMNNQAACSYCNTLPSDQQATCRTQLNCQ